MNRLNQLNGDRSNTNTHSQTMNKLISITLGRANFKSVYFLI